MNIVERLPQVIERAIIENRAKFYQYNADIEAKRAGEVIKGSFTTRPLVLSPDELQFWKMSDEESLMELLFEIKSAIVLDIPPEQHAILPEGYLPLAVILDFEDGCLGEGWGAVSNAGVAHMGEIIRCYELFQMPDEAKALLEGLNAYVSAGGEENSEEAEDAFEAAYANCRNSMPEFMDRIPEIIKYVSEHVENFSERSVVR